MQDDDFSGSELHYEDYSESYIDWDHTIKNNKIELTPVNQILKNQNELKSTCKILENKNLVELIIPWSG